MMEMEKKKYYSYRDLLEMGFSNNTLKKRFYESNYKKYGIELRSVRKRVKMVSHENYLKHFKGVIQNKLDDKKQ